VATPPRVTRTEVDAAITRIYDRHHHVDDPRRSGLSDDPAGVLEYLTRYSTTLPQWVIAKDTLDSLVLHTWLWWEDRRRERALLRRGKRAGLYLREMGAPLGINTHQGVRDRLDRLDALLAHDHPDEKLGRAARSEAARNEDRALWIAEHENQIRAVVETLLRELARVPALAPLLTDAPPDVPEDGGRDDERARLSTETAEWLTELRADLDQSAISPATLGLLGLTVAPLRILLHDTGLDPAHGLWRALRGVDRVRAGAEA
jgi:hypothetical protein